MVSDDKGQQQTPGDDEPIELGAPTEVAVDEPAAEPSSDDVPEAVEAEPVDAPADEAETIDAEPVVQADTATIEAPQDGDAFPVVAIGASAGGFEAFQELLENLPSDTGMAFVLIQHLDPTQESFLADLLNRRSTLPVKEGEQGEIVEPNHVYVIPPHSMMTIQEGCLELEPRGRVRGLQGAIDQFMSSLAADRGNKAIGVILSGTLSDGARGLTEIKAAGGFTFSQNLQSAKFPDMPRNAISSGHVDFVMRPSEIALQLGWLARQLASLPTATEEPGGPEEEKAIEHLLQVVRKRTGVDFNQYKRATSRRRIQRRMIATHQDSLASYVDFVIRDHNETQALADELLIHVTQFFRDKGVWDYFAERVLPEALREHHSDEPLRVWVPGCSNGAEVYTIALIVLEYQRTKGKSFPVQIFGTDISENAIRTARAGVYGQDILDDVPHDLLRRYFTQVSTGFEVTKTVRSLCVFAIHDIMQDPPFSNINIVSCRNLLIYLDTAAQRRVFGVLHYALRPGGILILGSSESTGRADNLFSPIDRDTRIYTRRTGATNFLEPFTQRKDGATEPRLPGEASDNLQQTQAPESTLRREIDRLMVERFSPTSIVVNKDLDVVFVRGDPSAYIRPATGPTSINLMKMAKGDLVTDLRDLVRRALEDRGPVTKNNISYMADGDLRHVNVEAVPVRTRFGVLEHVLLTFNEVHRPAENGRVKTKKASGSGGLLSIFGGGGKRSKEMEKRIHHLEHELAAAREHLESVVEDYESTVEELRCANEEILSSNEELQSTNEELQTATEESQSTTEELRTLNEELMHRSQEVHKINNDLINLLNSVEIPILMLGPDLTIRRFTRQAEALLNLIPTDMGRPFSDIHHPFHEVELEEAIQQVVESLQVRRLEAKDDKDHPYEIHVHPYRTTDDRIEGVVLLFMDREARS